MELGKRLQTPFRRAIGERPPMMFADFRPRPPRTPVQPLPTLFDVLGGDRFLRTGPVGVADDEGPAHRLNLRQFAGVVAHAMAMEMIEMGMPASA